MIGLADCNNFFVSCERSVDSSLEGKAVVVMSNNDGCVVARSNEAKRMGIKMGQPVFELRDMIRSGRLIAISGHHLLYKHISIHVHDIFRRYAPATIDYSVDEAFLDMDGIPVKYLKEIGVRIYEDCWREAHIPVTIGFARTKTLAKIATEVSKKAGIKVAVLASEGEEQASFEKMEIRDLWGVGRRLAKRLYMAGVYTVGDFARKDLGWVRRNYGVNGERSWLELHGHPCITLDHVGRALQESISESRTFPTDIDDYNYLRTRIAMYADHCSQKLRAMKGVCGVLGVFLRTNRFSETVPLQTPAIEVEFEPPVSDTSCIVEASLAGLEQIYNPRYKYKRGGVWMSEIVPACSVVPSLFATLDTPEAADASEEEQRRKKARLMEVIDRLNSGDVCVMPLATELTHSTPKSNDGYSSSFQFRK